MTSSVGGGAGLGAFVPVRAGATVAEPPPDGAPPGWPADASLAGVPALDGPPPESIEDTITRPAAATAPSAPTMRSGLNLRPRAGASPTTSSPKYFRSWRAVSRSRAMRSAMYLRRSISCWLFSGVSGTTGVSGGSYSLFRHSIVTSTWAVRGRFRTRPLAGGPSQHSCRLRAGRGAGPREGACGSRPHERNTFVTVTTSIRNTPEIRRKPLARSFPCHRPAARRRPLGHLLRGHQAWN